jgi:GTP-binding protein
LHLVDGTAEDIAGAYIAIRDELIAYGGGLAEKPEVLALNKCDALTAEAIAEKSAALAAAAGHPAAVLSGATGLGVEAVLRELRAFITKGRDKVQDSEEGGGPFVP